jgi:NitT/TauT family transport system substrate-binding protein
MSTFTKLVGLVLGAVLVGLLGASSGELPLACVRLNWFYQAQFAGPIVAEAKGFFRQEGVEVNLAEGGPTARWGRMVHPATCEEDNPVITSNWLLDSLEAITNPPETKTEMIHVAQLFQAPGGRLVKLQSFQLQDGMKVGIFGVTDGGPIKAFLEAQGIEAQYIPAERLSYPFSPLESFLLGSIDAFYGLTYNEVRLAEIESQEPIEALELGEFGVLEDALWVHPESLDTQEEIEIVIKVVRAIFRGWLYAREHPEETLEIICLPRYADCWNESLVEHQRHQLEKTLELFFAGPHQEEKWGQLSREEFDKAVFVFESFTGREAPSYEELTTDTILSQLNLKEKGGTDE